MIVDEASHPAVVGKEYSEALGRKIIDSCQKKIGIHFASTFIQLSVFSVFFMVLFLPAFYAQVPNRSLTRCLHNNKLHAVVSYKQFYLPKKHSKYLPEYKPTSFCRNYVFKMIKIQLTCRRPASVRWVSWPEQVLPHI